MFKANPDHLRCFVDSDWTSCPNDRRSYTGHVVVLNSGPISWESKKQREPLSSLLQRQSTWGSRRPQRSSSTFVTELGFQELANVVILNDNLGAQKLAENPVFHARSKYIDVRHHYILEVLKDNRVKVIYISTQDMVADVLTKGLPRLKHRKCVEMLGLESPMLTSRPRIEGKC